MMTAPHPARAGDAVSMIREERLFAKLKQQNQQTCHLCLCGCVCVGVGACLFE